MYTDFEIDLLSHCTICPRNCGVNRLNKPAGYCNSNAGFNISSICIHKGEEPVISGSKGICNIFFPHCNLQCIFCQNHDISVNTSVLFTHLMEFDDVINKICETLEQTENIVGFVSPSHYVPQMLAIIRGVKKKGKSPVFVYNTNGYDKVETLKMLEGIIDVYLPDFKYIDAELAFRYSKVKDYPEIVAEALKEMYRQKGTSLIINDNGIAESGIIIRHLILPGATDQSIEVLKFIANELSPKLHISLMSQYYPAHKAINNPELGRNLTEEEYFKVTEAFHKLGFYRGWIQDLGSHNNYRPDFFSKIHFKE